METLGLPRSYFYNRIALAMREVIARSSTGEGQQQEMVTHVKLQDAIDRLRVCPVCGAQLAVYADYPMERSCSCGDFIITVVWSDGDVTFEFKMTAVEKIEAEAQKTRDNFERNHDDGG